MIHRVKLPLLAAVIAASTPLHAFQKFEDYRILGSEILFAKEVLSDFEEDPAVLELKLRPESGDSITLEIETDGDLEDCVQVLQYLIGDPYQYAQIVVQVNAPTLNGSLIVQCNAVGLR